MFSVVSKGRSLFNVLAQKGTEVLDNLIGRLCKAVKRTEINEGRNSNSRACLEIQILFVLPKNIYSSF